MLNAEWSASDKYTLCYRLKKHLSFNEGMIWAKTWLPIKRCLKDDQLNEKQNHSCSLRLIQDRFSMLKYTGTMEHKLGFVGNTVICLLTSYQPDGKADLLRSCDSGRPSAVCTTHSYNMDRYEKVKCVSLQRILLSHWLLKAYGVSTDL